MIQFRTPVVILPLGNIHRSITSIQSSECRKYENQLIECMEAYGWARGRVKCKDEMEDFYECLHSTKRLRRISLMRAEMEQQVSKGKRDWFPGPRLDTY